MMDTKYIFAYVLSSILTVVAIVSFSSFHRVVPDPGTEAILIHKPLFFGTQGVDESPVKNETKWVWTTTDFVMIDLKPLLYSEHFTDLMSSDGVPLEFESNIRLQIVNGVSLIKNFGINWYETNITMQIRNLVRQAVRKHSLNETVVSSTAIDAIDEEVFKNLSEYIEAQRLPVSLISFTVGRATPPESIKVQRVQTATEQQRILTEQQRKLAEDQRKMAEDSRAQADMAYNDRMKIDAEKYMIIKSMETSIKSMELLKEGCNANHCTFYFGNDSQIMKVLSGIIKTN